MLSATQKSSTKISLQLPLLAKKAEFGKASKEASSDIFQSGCSLTATMSLTSASSESKASCDSQIKKSQEVLSSPSCNRYDSTSSTSHCDGEEDKENIENKRLRRKLKRRV